MEYSEYLCGITVRKVIIDGKEDIDIPSSDIELAYKDFTGQRIYWRE